MSFLELRSNVFLWTLPNHSTINVIIVISSDPLCKDGNMRFTMARLKALTVNYNFENWLFSIVVSLQKWLAHFLILHGRKTYRNYYNETWTTKQSSTLLISYSRVPSLNRALQYLHGIGRSLEIKLTVPRVEVRPFFEVRKRSF